MFILSSGLALTMAAYLADPVEVAQRDFSNCLIDVIIEQLDAKIGQAAFNKTIVKACEEEKSQFHTAVVKDERGYGSSQAEATQYADEEVQGIIDGFKQSYGDYASSNSRPVKE